jgi:fatty acid desaturase
MLTGRAKLKREGRAGPIFAYSNLDVIPVLFALAQLAAIIGTSLTLEYLGTVEICAYAFSEVILTATMYHVVIHNFIHTKYFNSATLNSFFALICSVAVADSFTGQMLEHFNHHKYVNDQIDPTTAGTNDSASTYRFGRNGAHESIWRYSLLSPLRQLTDTPSYNGRRDRMLRRIRSEVGSILIFWASLGCVDWRFLPLWVIILYAARAVSSAQNYFEHYGAAANFREASSVSCYGRLYNLLWLNNGYHQEHHFSPATHWTKLPKLRCEMWPEDRRRVVSGAHFFNYPSKYRPDPQPLHVA